VTTTTNPGTPGDRRPGRRQQTICSKTGLALIRTSNQATTRIAKSSYGPLSPLLRDETGDPREWGRYDVAGHRTVYSASPAQGAYAESLAIYRPATSLRTLTLGDLFDDEVDPHAPLAAAVTDEWDQRFHTQTGYVPAAWRDERLEYRLHLPHTGWVVDIEHSQSIATLNDIAWPDRWARLLPGGRSHLTTSDLHGENRLLTTAVAQWIRSQVLEDGTQAHGIGYHSKHGTNWRCWAIWLRIVDDGQDPSEDILREPTRAGPGAEIRPPDSNAPLREVSDLFRLHVL